MELKEYLKIIGQSWGKIMAITLFIGLVTLIWSLIQPIKYESAVTIAVNKPNPVPQRAAQFYQYDKFYSIQASSLFADTLTAWLSSPGTAKEIFEKAALPVPNVSLRKLGKIFKPRRLPPVTLSLSVIDRDQLKAENLVKAAVLVIEDKTAESRKNDDSDHFFSIIAGPIVTAPTRLDHSLNAIVGLIGGLLIALVYVFTREYLRR